VNLSKHGVDFAEAMTVFGDPFEATNPDPVHSGAELRFVGMGLSQAGRLLVVYTERDALIRIVSARESTPVERTSCGSMTSVTLCGGSITEPTPQVRM
jgi:uncharacterized protein